MVRAQTYRVVRTVVLALVTSASLWLALVTSVYAEAINSFEVDMEVQSAGRVLVTETITYDFGAVQRHGIYRDISEVHQQESSSWLKERYVDLKLISVSRDGQSEPYALENYDGLSVRIGDANSTISGVHEYQIIYEMDGAISTYDTGQELYWNVTGDQWQVPMNDVVVTLRAADGVVFESEHQCYVGSYSSTESCAAVSNGDSESVFSHDFISTGQQITIAQRLTLSQAPTVVERTNTLPLWIIICLAWFIGLGTWLWRWHSQFKNNRAVVAQYEPYKDFKPMFTGVLIDNTLDQRDLTAGIIYLAEQGFLAIKQTKDKVLFFIETTDYELTLKRPVSELETVFQKELLSLFELNTVGETIKLSEIKKSQSKLRKNQKIIQGLKKAAVKDLVDLGFLQQQMSRGVRVGLIVSIIFLGFFILPVIIAAFGVNGLGISILLFGTGLLYLIFGIERRTTRGYEALNYLKGFKDFLSTTDKDRYKFHNAPDRNAEQFMQYLPFAVAFGVEKDWAEVFKDIQIVDPNWYSSANGAAFNAVAFTTDIGAFSTAFASASAPQGPSGSGGGGFSGGGGGGGGGGSW